MTKKTAWYPASVNPVRDGLYEFRMVTKICMVHYSAKRGWTYNGYAITVFRFYDKWRGLAAPK